MATKGILIFNWEGKPIISMDLAYPFKHKPRDINQTKSTMNQYKIGDTVWTRKRGKGTITDHSHYTAQDRPWRVHFESCVGFYSPKAENLYPSEAAMNADQMKREAFDFAEWFKLVIDKASKPKPPRPPFASGGIVHDPHLRGSDFMFKPDPIQPKFKVGDAVYFDRKKWDVEDVATNECKIRISASAGSCTREFRAWTVVKESDLRLWVETKFTEGLSSFDDKWVKNDYYIDPSWTIMYIGKIVGKDTFVATGLSGSPALFRGIKGDDL